MTLNTPLQGVLPETLVLSDELRLESLKLVRAQWEAALATGTFPVVEYWIRNRRIRRLNPLEVLDWIDRRIAQLESKSDTGRNFARLGGHRKC